MHITHTVFSTLLSSVVSASCYILFHVMVKTNSPPGASLMRIFLLNKKIVSKLTYSAQSQGNAREYNKERYNHKLHYYLAIMDPNTQLILVKHSMQIILNNYLTTMYLSIH